MTTHWSVVQAAVQPRTDQCQQALETLCQTYWFPVYAYLRRWGHAQDQAEDGNLLGRALEVTRPERERGNDHRREQRAGRAGADQQDRGDQKGEAEREPPPAATV